MYWPASEWRTKRSASLLPAHSGGSRCRSHRTLRRSRRDQRFDSCHNVPARAGPNAGAVDHAGGGEAMAEILGIGATHYPPGMVPEEYKPWPLARMLETDRRIPERLRDPANWPEPMRNEWGDDQGITSHKVHKARIFDAFRKIRAEI